jgi:hypothetical protein
MDFGIWYPKGEDFTLTTYTDADWAGSVDDRKSTSGGAILLGKLFSILAKKKQSSISLSTTKVRVHCSNIMLHTNSLDETNTARH